MTRGEKFIFIWWQGEQTDLLRQQVSLIINVMISSMRPVWPEKSRQMSIKVAQKWLILTPLRKFPKNVGDLGKLMVAKGFEKFPKSKKSPDLVTLLVVWKTFLPLKDFLLLERQSPINCPIWSHWMRLIRQLIFLPWAF